MSLPAHAVARPETRVEGFFPSPLKSASADLDQTAGLRWENRGCGYDFASGVCKYLYAHGNPVNMVDPSGHFGIFKFTREFGNQAHRVIEDEYQAEHPGAIVGTTTGILGTGLKPDIFDGINHTFMEIKPLSLSGVAKGSAQILGYQAAFTLLGVGYSRGTWPDTARASNVGAVPIIYFNVQGVIFYTDSFDNVDDLTGIVTFAAARQLIIRNSALMTRTLGGIMIRIPGMVAARGIADTSRLQTMTGIATLNSLMGAP